MKVINNSIGQIQKYYLFLDAQNLALKEKLKKDDLDNSLECLQSYEKQISDIKTSYDVFVYPTSNGWRAVIDVDHVRLAHS